MRSALAAMMLADSGIGQGDTFALLMPHSIEQIVWVQAAKRIGAIYACLPESISVANLAGRIFDISAKLVVTSTAKSPTEGASLKAVATHAVMDHVSMEAVLRTVRRVLPEQRWRTVQGPVDIRSVCDALEASFKGDGAVSPREVASKLEMVFSMMAPLREKATELAAHLKDEMHREHAARVRTKLLVVPHISASKEHGEEAAPAAAAAGAAVDRYVAASKSTLSPSAAPFAMDPRALQAAASKLTIGSGISETSPAALRTGGARRPPAPASPKDSPLGPARRVSSHSNLTAAAHPLTNLLYRDELLAEAEPRLLSAAAVASYEALLELPDRELVAALWSVSPPMVLPSGHPKSVVYTSGTSGYKATGLCHDTGGYCAGVVETMRVCLDASPGKDIIFVDARPSWVTGQTYGITGALCSRLTAVLCRIPDDAMPQSLAMVVKQLGVTVFIAGASFLKRALRNERQAAWLQRQELRHTLRIAVSCGEPLSPAMQKLGMATLCPNYINSYWASEHGAIILGHSYGDASQPLAGDARMYPMPWVDAAVWLPVGEVRSEDEGRTRFAPAEPTAAGSAKGRLVVTKPWPSMARTVWGDAAMAGSAGWVGDLDTYRDRYWSTFCGDDGSPVMALDLADLAQAFRGGGGAVSFSVLGHSRDPHLLPLFHLAPRPSVPHLQVLGHSREELRLGTGASATVVSAAELEEVLLSSSVPHLLPLFHTSSLCSAPRPSPLCSTPTGAPLLLGTRDRLRSRLAARAARARRRRHSAREGRRAPHRLRRPPRRRGALGECAGAPQEAVPRDAGRGVRPGRLCTDLGHPAHAQRQVDAQRRPAPLPLRGGAAQGGERDRKPGVPTRAQGLHR